MHIFDSIGTADRNHKLWTEKHYEGKRSHGERFVTVNGRALDPRFDLRVHSPDGFEWGYGGSGPAQLALAILANWLANDLQAQALYQDFKSRTVAAFAKGGWTLSGGQIEEVLRAMAVEGNHRTDGGGRSLEDHLR